MLTYDLSKRGNVPLYEFLYERIKRDILCGELRRGEKLPSKRSLAQHLSVSVITVQNAYEQLLAEGYITSVAKSGYFVADVETVSEVSTAFVQETENSISYPVDLVRGSADEDSMAYSVWVRIMRGVITQYGKALLEPMHFQGVAVLRSAIADFLKRFRGMTIDPSQIVIGAGTEYLYTLIMQLLGRDVVYGYEDPGYRKIREIIAINGVEGRPIIVDKKGLSVNALKESDVSVVHTSPAHHFPTGVTMPIGRRQELLSWTYADPRRYILEDDYDSEFRFSGKPIQTLFDIDRNDRVIYINTFSKTISPSLRISYMVLPKSLLTKYRMTMSFYACTVSSLEQYVLAQYIANGSFERHINRCRKLYRQKRNEITDIISKSLFSPYVTIMEEDAGLHFLLHIDSAYTEDELRAFFVQHGVRISFLSEYSVVGNHIPKCAVINYAGVSVDRFKETIAQLEVDFKMLL